MCFPSLPKHAEWNELPNKKLRRQSMINCRQTYRMKFDAIQFIIIIMYCRRKLIAKPHENDEFSHLGVIILMKI